MKKGQFKSFLKKGLLGSVANPSFFDVHGIPRVAYSFRDLNGTNPIVATFRRALDNSEESFTASQVTDGTDIVSFAGGSDLFLKTFHCQVDSANDATQNGTAVQPKFYESSSFFTFGDKKSLVFQNNADALGFFSSAFKTGVSDVYMMLRSNQNRGIIFNDAASGANYGYAFYQNDFGTAIYSNYGSPSLYVNGSLQSVTTRDDVYNAIQSNYVAVSITGQNVSSWTSPRLGIYVNSGNFISFSGHMPELIVYDENTTNLTDIVNDQKAYYQI